MLQMQVRNSRLAALRVNFRCGRFRRKELHVLNCRFKAKQTVVETAESGALRSYDCCCLKSAILQCCMRT